VRAQDSRLITMSSQRVKH